MYLLNELIQETQIRRIQSPGKRFVWGLSIRSGLPPLGFLYILKAFMS